MTSSSALRQIGASGPYRLAFRLWRLRALLTTPLRRRGSRRGGAELETGADLTTTADQWLSTGSGSAGETDGTFEERNGNPATVRAVRLLGLTQEQLVRQLAELHEAGLVTAELLVVTDCDALRSLDEYGCQYEYVPPREQWENLLGRDSGEYDDFIHRRMAMIGAVHGVTPVTPGSLATSR